jgi:phage tail sheath protein FI
MPEYLAPGVYVEEVSFRSKSIEGVATTTTGFVGPTRYGPVTEDLDVLTSLADFERIYGDRQRLVFDSGGTPVVTHNYMWHAARAFFENGGARLYVKRVFLAKTGSTGQATGEIANTAGTVTATARFSGAAGGRKVDFTLQRGPNVLVADTGGKRVVGVQDRDVVAIHHPATASYAASFFLALRDAAGDWSFEPAPTGSPPAPGTSLTLADLDPTVDEVRIVTVTVTDYPPDPYAIAVTWTGLPLDPSHLRAGVPDSVFATFAADPPNRAAALELPIVLTADAGLDGVDVLGVLLAGSAAMAAALFRDDSTVAERTTSIVLTNGNDGLRPTQAEYEGGVTAADGKLGLVAFEDVDDIAIVAAPGSSFEYEEGYKSDAASIQQSLIGHCERMRYRIAVLDSGDGQSVAMVRRMRAAIDSTHAAFYYPWVTVLDPVTQRDIQLPPSGFVCGIYARNDIERAVYKAPANEVVTLAIGFENILNKAQQDVLNPEGVNCFRYFPGRGYRLWGARTATSDPEWKYVNLRRYFAYLEHSVDRGTQWAVFEPNGDRLWANVRRTIEDFLFNEWQSGALLGDKPEKAFFVRCDRTTMTQADLDNGRLVCLVGVAALRPAEYVIFRIGQWTADRRP